MPIKLPTYPIERHAKRRKRLPFPTLLRVGGIHSISAPWRERCVRVPELFLWSARPVFWPNCPTDSSFFSAIMPLMSAFSFVQHLPIDLLRLCLQYLPLTDVAIFDHAILSHKYRPTFLAAIEGLELFDINFYLTSDLIQWLMTRGVLIKSIPLSSSDANLLELINYSHSSLKSIDLSHSRLSDDLISAFLSMCPNLVSINFHCSHLTDYGLRSLLEVKRNLQHLNLSGCTKITSDSLQILAQYGSALRNLNLSSLRWMTDAELLIILDGCPQIQDINVSSTYITIDSIVAIIQRYPMLNSLIFSGCARVTRDATKLLLRSVYSRQIMSKDPSIQLQGVLQLNNAFSSGIRPNCLFIFLLLDPRLISEMISLDLLPRLVSLLNSSPSSVTLCFTSVMVLGNSN